MGGSVFRKRKSILGKSVELVLQYIDKQVRRLLGILSSRKGEVVHVILLEN